MSRELSHPCPGCETERSFTRIANTQVHLGEKVKWRCPECEYRFVRIDGDVDTASA